MLKLKDLFNNVDLAEMLVKNWDYDTESLEMFKYYRISSNAIYPFQVQGKTQLLRFAPIESRFRENILAEFDFIKYLRANDYGVLATVLSKKGEELVEQNTPWGHYFAAVFKRVSGVQLSGMHLNDQIIYEYGKALGRLHRLSSVYQPNLHKRWSYIDVFNWMNSVLTDVPLQSSAIEELKILREYFGTVPKDHHNFGLIHYDFELDNVFYDEETGSIQVIDFDDSMYHWYVMDIQQALESLRDGISPEDFAKGKQRFMEGYRSEYELTHEMESILPGCQRFANLFGYVRILSSMKESWENEPSWLTHLRERLTRSMQGKSAYFGTEVK